MGQAMVAVTIDFHHLKPRHQFTFKLVAECLEPFPFGFHLLFGDGTGRTESDNAADVQGAGTEAALVATTILDGFQSDPRPPPPNVQSADPFGRTSCGPKATASQCCPLRHP